MGHSVDSEIITFTINQDGSNNALDISKMLKAERYEITDQTLMLYECALNTWQKELKIQNGSGFYLTTWIEDTPL